MLRVPMTTDDIMKVALLMVGLPSTPPDSGVHVPGNGIRRVLFTLEADSSTVLAAKQMEYDAVISLNPIGASAITHPLIMDQHVQQLVDSGVAEDDARQAVRAYREETDVVAHASANHQVDSLARLLGMPLVNVKFPLEQIARVRMLNAIKTHAGEQASIEKIVEALYTLPEFRDAESPIALRMGNESNIAGKVAVAHGAGKSPDVDIVRAYFNAGVGTVVQAEIRYSDLKTLRTYPDPRNIIITGTIPTNLLGINPYIDELEKRGLIVDRIGGL